MMEKVCTDTLRSNAPKWSLGGDKQLLDLLQNLHKKIITNCTETNTKLDELVNSLDTASIDLQNVNNKFMALSNSQFIERRVYDDDIDVAPEVSAPKDPKKQEDPQDELLKIKRSIQVLESMHETVQIVDSDSSDEEDEGRMVLKPKDAYCGRPLPHVIGSDSWRKKWHAGLLVEDSDTESAGSKSEPREEYSDSEPEVTDTQTDKLYAKNGTGTGSRARAEAGPALVAARLAERLGADTIATPPAPAPPSPPPPAPAPLYRPQQPVTATIFFNEPPPLEREVVGGVGGVVGGVGGVVGEVGGGAGSESESDDIFAELHRDSFTRARGAAVVDELFGSVAGPVGDERSEDQMTKDTKDVLPVSDKIPEPELFERPKEKLQAVTNEAGFKKPVGGISLFGSNKDSSNIGAAILKRQQRKSSDEESDDSDSKPLEKHSKASVTEKSFTKTNNTEIINNKTVSSNNKNIIEDLFIKPKTKKTVSNVHKENEVKTEQKTKLDLFDDDLFDDIDDIFTSKVVIKKPDANNKSIFDDDLFSDVTVGKKETIPENKEKSVFDSDDELFGEKKVSNSNIAKKSKIKETGDELLGKYDGEETKYISVNKEIGSERKKSIFDDDSDDNLFNFKSTSKKNSITDDQTGELFDKTKLKDKIVSAQTKSQSIQNLNTPFEKINKTLIGSDETENVDSDSTLNIVKNLPKNPLKINVNTNKQNSKSDNDSEEELFSGNNQVTTKSEEMIESRTEFDDVKNQNKESSTLIEENDQLNELLRNSKTLSDENANMDCIKRNPEKLISDMMTYKEGLLSKDNLNVPRDKENIERQTDQVQSPSLFDDDEMDDLFSDKLKKSGEVRGNNRDINIMDTVMDDDLIKSQDEALFCETPQPPIPILSKYEDNTNNNDQKLYDSEIKQHLQDVLISSHTDHYSENSYDSNSDILPKKGEVTDAPNVVEQSSPITDIFNDIPPEFEKPKEPKKSKNVNALFDDDSDDEMLFFKKNSDVADEPPSPSYKNERFSLFHDEPPAIEVDFTPQSVRPNTNLTIDSPNEMYGDIFNSQSEIKQLSNTDTLITNVETNATIPNIFDSEVQSVVKKDLIKSNSEQPEQSLEDSIRSTNELIANNINKLQTDFKRQNDDETKQKSIGKLKVNFNINVSTLLPGASPKKSKINEELDGTAPSKLPETGMEKSVNFEADKESGILDNKLSKDRAKIQVKRRPSTRRARKEAARKSGIDFGESFDSTDNSSSIDQPEKQYEVKEEQDNKDKDNIFEGEINKTNDKSLKNNGSEDTNESKSKNVTKVVYILNDEDIFSNANENVKEQNKTASAKPFSNLGSHLDTKPSASTDKKDIDRNPTDNINRSASTDKKLDSNRNSVESNADKSKTSIFDLSDSDSELFGAKTIKVKPKTKLFDSDTDDDDLFASKRDKTKAFEEKKGIKIVKGSLFGDESDDDLFATSTKSNEKLRSKPKEVSNNTSEPVFVDPLSLLSRDNS